MWPADPCNPCGVPVLSSGRDRSGLRRLGLPLLRLAASRHRAVVYLAARGRRAVQGRAARGHLAGGRGRRHAFALTTVCSAWRWRVAAQALGIGIGLPDAVRCLLPLPFPQLRAHRRGSRRREPGGHARPTQRRRGAGTARGGVGTAVRSGRPGRGDRRRVADPALAGPARAAICSEDRGRRGCSRVCCAGREAQGSPRPVVADPRRAGRYR